MEDEDAMMWHWFKPILNGLHLTLPSGLSYSKCLAGDYEFRFFKNFAVLYKAQAGPIQIEIGIGIGIENEASRRSKMTLKCSSPPNWVDFDTDFDFDPDAA